MSELSTNAIQKGRSLPKWPFYLADALLSAIATYVLWRLGALEGTADIIIALACLAAAAWGAWLSITPWLVEFRAQSTLTETQNLRSSLEQVQGIEKVADLIKQSNSQWQNIQDSASRTVTAAQEISERMKTESEEFMKFLENAHDQERAALRLEAEKLRRMEGEWIKVTVQILDHIYAISRAAERSGQQNLIAQLAQFQNACREVARRMGLVPTSPAVGDLFDGRAHQLPELQSPPPANAVIGQVLATGFSYQGQPLRRALVLLADSAAETKESQPEANAEEFPASEPGEEPLPVAESESEPDGNRKSDTEQDELPLV
jgi:molecular chaperone GrpE (heat shock protein)